MVLGRRAAAAGRAAVLVAAAALALAANDRDIAALEALRAGFDAAPRGWNTTDVCAWPGVTCTGARVTSVSLSSQPLGGVIAPGISGADNLFELSLTNLGLRGTVPAELADLGQLVTLAVSANPLLEGPLPPELGSIAPLRFVVFTFNAGLDGPIPSEYGNLSSLRQLSLFNNALSGTVPTALEDLAESVADLVVNLDCNFLEGESALLSGSACATCPEESDPTETGQCTPLPDDEDPAGSGAASLFVWSGALLLLPLVV